MLASAVRIVISGLSTLAALGWMVGVAAGAAPAQSSVGFEPIPQRGGAFLGSWGKPGRGHVRAINGSSVGGEATYAWRIAAG